MGPAAIPSASKCRSGRLRYPRRRLRYPSKCSETRGVADPGGGVTDHARSHTTRLCALRTLDGYRGHRGARCSAPRSAPQARRRRPRTPLGRVREQHGSAMPVGPTAALRGPRRVRGRALIPPHLPTRAPAGRPSPRSELRAVQTGGSDSGRDRRCEVGKRIEGANSGLARIATATVRLSRHSQTYSRGDAQPRMSTNGNAPRDAASRTSRTATEDRERPGGNS